MLRIRVVGVVLLPLALLLGCGSDNPSDSSSDAGSAGTLAATSGAAGMGAANGNGGTGAQGGTAPGGGSGGKGGTSTAGGGTSTAGPRGAVSIHIAPGSNCSLADTWVDFPKLASGHPVTGSAHGSLLQDKTRDANGWTVQVGCKWLEEADPYFASLGIGLIGDADQRLVSLSPFLSVGTQQDGTITFLDSESTPRLSGPADPQCQFEAIAVDFPGGSLWGKLTCARVVDEDATEDCAVNEGYFYFEGCMRKP
jgi:hypothetical protein